MKFLRSFLGNSIEKSIETIDAVSGGRHLVARKEVRHDEIVQWDLQYGHLTLLLTRRTDSSDYYRKLEMVLDGNKNVQNLSFESSLTHYDDERHPSAVPHSEFEGELDNLNIIKIGRAAIALHESAKIIRSAGLA